MTTDKNAEKVAEAAAATVNGNAASVKNPLPLSKAIALATDLGFGFTGLAVAATSATFAINSFRHAWQTVRS